MSPEKNKDEEIIARLCELSSQSIPHYIMASSPKELTVNLKKKENTPNHLQFRRMWLLHLLRCRSRHRASSVNLTCRVILRRRTSAARGILWWKLDDRCTLFSVDRNRSSSTIMVHNVDIRPSRSPSLLFR